jgi:FkbM family methyltransferase
MRPRSLIKRWLLSRGYVLRRASDEVGKDPFLDMKNLAGDGPLVVIDAGANLGQSIFDFHSVFRDPVIHAFEPGLATFAELQQRTSGLHWLHLNNCGLGSRPAVIKFVQNSQSDMSSFLEPTDDCWGTIQERRDTLVRTLDEYCSEENVPGIDILKSDTQGFDLEVIKGAKELLSRNAIHLILVEVILWGLYKGIPSVGEIYSFLTEQGFSLVSFYQFHYQHPKTAWTDALFVNPNWTGRNGLPATPRN